MERSGGTAAIRQEYMADISEARRALDTVDPTSYFVKYVENTWAAVRGYLDAITASAAARSSRRTPASSPRRTSSPPAPRHIDAIPVYG